MSNEREYYITSHMSVSKCNFTNNKGTLLYFHKIKLRSIKFLEKKNIPQKDRERAIFNPHIIHLSKKTKLQ